MRSNKHAMTIIKRSGRKAHHGVHTGAWKVAFADFTLAMMALFMVLWIVGAVTEEERKEIVAQLNGESIFDGSGFTPVIEDTGMGATIVAMSYTPDRAQEENQTPVEKEKNAPAVAENDAPESLDSVLNRSDQELQALSELIAKIAVAFNAQQNLTLEKVPQGLRILIQDDSDRMMFPRGSAVMTSYFEQLLTELAPIFNRLDNQIMITGHTDAAPYRDSTTYNNWNLSGDRALAARRVLERGGVQPDRVIQVNAMASRMLLDQENPMAARNRRIEIMVLTKAAAETLYQFYGHHGVKVVQPIVERMH
ncbi:putative lateral flagellar export/assembly protein LafU [Enterobacteriaceae bacterium LUAb1]